MTGEQTPKQRTWPHLIERWPLAGILLLAFALRVYRLGDKNIWWDEGYSLGLARKTFLDATLTTAGDVHPPLYYWHLWAWVRLVGESEFAARFISVIWAVLAVAVVYALGTRLGGRRAGLLAALFLAVARFHIWWSQEMRMHILATLAAALVLYTAVRWLEEERARRPGEPGPSWCAWPVRYALASAACLYTLYLAGLAPLVANAYAVVGLARVPRVRRWRVAALWLAAQVAVLLLFAPWVLLAVRHMQTWSVSEPFRFRLLLALYGTLLGLGVSTHIERYLIYLLPFAAALAGGLATLWRPRRDEPGLPGGQSAFLLLLAVSSAPLGVYIMTRPRSLFYTPRVEARYLVLFLPAFCTLVAWSIVRLGRRFLPLGLAALAACLGVVLAFLPGYYAGRHLRDEMQSMVHILGTYARPDEVILLISGNRYPVFAYYYERIVPPQRRIPIVALPQAERFTIENVAGELEKATAGRGRFWVAAVDPAIQDPAGLSLPWLEQHFPRLMTYDEGHNWLALYGEGAGPMHVDRDSITPQRSLQVRMGTLELLGYDLPVRECQAGDMVNLGLYWASEELGRVEIEWRHNDGQLLQSVSQDWPATHPAAARAAIRFAVSPNHPSGATCLLLRWTSADGQSAAQTLQLPGPRVLAAPGGRESTQMAQPLDVTFADGISLRAFNLHRPLQDGLAEARSGEELVLDLFWEARQPVGSNYTIFTQLVGDARHPATGLPVWGQHDGAPGEGRYPSRTWPVGQVILDRHVFKIDPAAPAGDYELKVGLYLPATMTRLRLLHPDSTEGDDHVTLARVRLTR
jgi:4-amino-4-deoxy-L-arabinose transferase-like glycosyltransferase